MFIIFAFLYLVVFLLRNYFERERRREHERLYKLGQLTFSSTKVKSPCDFRAVRGVKPFCPESPLWKSGQCPLPLAGSPLELYNRNKCFTSAIPGTGAYVREEMHKAADECHRETDARMYVSIHSWEDRIMLRNRPFSINVGHTH